MEEGYYYICSCRVNNGPICNSDTFRYLKFLIESNKNVEGHPLNGISDSVLIAYSEIQEESFQHKIEKLYLLVREGDNVKVERYNVKDNGVDTKEKSDIHKTNNPKLIKIFDKDLTEYIRQQLDWIKN